MDKRLLAALKGSLLEQEFSNYYKGTIYGPDGVGKTIAAAKVARKLDEAVDKRTLYWAIDPGGSDSFYNHPELGYGSLIKPMKFLGLSQADAIADAFWDKEDPFTDFGTLIVDTASNIAALNIDLITGYRVKEKGGKPFDTNFEPSYGDFDFMRDMMGVYNQTTLQLRSSFLKLLLAPVNVILIAHDRMWEDKKNTGQTFTMPSFTPEVYKAISRMCSQVIYMTADVMGSKGLDKSKVPSYRRKMQFHPSGSIIAKSHIGGLPVEAVNVKLEDIIFEWQQKGGKLESRPVYNPEVIPQELQEETFGLA